MEGKEIYTKSHKSRIEEETLRETLGRIVDDGNEKATELANQSLAETTLYQHMMANMLPVYADKQFKEGFSSKTVYIRAHEIVMASLGSMARGDWEDNREK